MALLAARGSTAFSSTPATPTRHGPRHSSHGYLDHGSTTHALGYIDIGTKGYHPLEQLVGFLYSQCIRDATPSTTFLLGLRGDVSPSAAILSSLTVRDAHVVRNATATTAGDVRDIFGSRDCPGLDRVISILSLGGVLPFKSCTQYILALEAQ